MSLDDLMHLLQCNLISPHSLFHKGCFLSFPLPSFVFLASPFSVPFFPATVRISKFLGEAPLVYLHQGSEYVIAAAVSCVCSCCVVFSYGQTTAGINLSSVDIRQSTATLH